MLYFSWSCFELFWSMHISWNIYHLVYILDVFASLRVSCSDSRIEFHIIVMDLGSEITSVMKRNYMWLISNQRECNYIFVLKITNLTTYYTAIFYLKAVKSIAKLLWSTLNPQKPSHVCQRIKRVLALIWRNN